MTSASTQNFISLIGALSTIILFIASTFYTDFYNKPFIKAQVIPDGRNATIEIRNNGLAAAKHLLLTILAPKPILKYNISHSENYSNIDLTKNVLIISIPRFVNGNGSVFTANVLLVANPNKFYNNYTAYVTYDDGSVTATVKGTRLPSVYEEITNILQQALGFFLDPYRIVVIAILAIIVFVSLRYYLKRRQDAPSNRFKDLIYKLIEIRDKLRDSPGYKNELPSVRAENIKYIFVVDMDEFSIIEQCDKRINTHNLYVRHFRIRDERILSRINQSCSQSVTQALTEIRWEKYEDLLK